MCVVSGAFDSLRPVMPRAETINWVTISPPEIEELRQLVKEFHAMIAAAKKIDFVLKQPDCVDPEKEKLELRVKELETKLAEVVRLAAP